MGDLWCEGWHDAATPDMIHQYGNGIGEEQKRKRDARYCVVKGNCSRDVCVMPLIERVPGVQGRSNSPIGKEKESTWTQDARDLL